MPDEGCCVPMPNEQAPSPPASELVPPTCGEPHTGFQTCRGPEAGCYGLAGDYAEDARYIYPAREDWYRTKLGEANRQHKADRERIAELENAAKAVLQSANKGNEGAPAWFYVSVEEMHVLAAALEQSP